MKKSIARLTIGLACFGASCAGASANAERVAQGINRFSAELFTKLNEAEPGANIFYSPYSISTAMAMARAGAGGDTVEEIDRALHFPAGAALHRGHGSLAQTLHAAPDIRLNIANGLTLTRHGALVRPDYKDKLEELYDAEIFKGDVDTINAWVSGKTEGRIEKLLEQLDPMSVCVILNAIYFKGNWATEFNEEETTDAPFHVAPDRTEEVPLMYRQGDVNYLETDDFQAVELPYRGDALSMIVVLPVAEADWFAPEGVLNAGFPADAIAQLEAARPREVKLYLPRFTLETEYNLVAPLQSLGVDNAFRQGEADFSGIAGRQGDLWINQIAHKAFVEVNEEGTEAAAATGIEMRTTALAPPPPVFRADRPFLFVIRHRPTGTILFAGRLANPAE